MLLSAASNSVNYGHPEKTADNVNFSNCYPSNYSNQPNVYSYSNTVVNSNMPSNLQVVPHIQNLSSGNAAENRSSSQTREIRQITHGDDDVQNYYRYNNSSYNYPVTSDSGVLQASLVYSQESGGFGGNSGIKIDPSLNQLGAGVMAEHNSNRKFSGQWRPNTSYGFWPQAEYLADGGDGSGNGRFDNARVQVDNDWTVRNLETGDTVAHYDTIDGRVEVEASNRVHIYAPRFGAVRKVIGVVNTDHISSLGEMNHQVSIGTGNSSSGIGKTSQEFAAGYTRGRDDLRGIQSRVMGAGLESNHGVIRYSNFESVISYSDTLRLKNLSSAEIIHLAEGYKNARAWQGTGGVQVKASYRVPMSMSLDEGAGQLFKVDDSGITGNSKLRLIKTASKSAAKSGDIIEFTLRFDNLGTEPIGNITIIDNLTTRLEFISDSAMASVPAGFFTEPNGSASFTLRFEITDPLEAGQFGVVQFRCRVL
jgi:uncharacterized repeat protein (TIGR01451 family)